MQFPRFVDQFTHKYKSDTQNPLSDSFKDEKEAGDPYLYECTCLFTPLNTLDLLVQYEMASTPEEFAKVAAYLAANKPPPFERVFHYEGFTQLDDPSLFEINGAPHIAFILKPDIVVICNATTGERSFMKCNIKGDIDVSYSTNGAFSFSNRFNLLGPLSQCYSDFTRTKSTSRHKHNRARGIALSLDRAV